MWPAQYIHINVHLRAWRSRTIGLELHGPAVAAANSNDSNIAGLNNYTCAEPTSRQGRLRQPDVQYCLTFIQRAGNWQGIWLAPSERTPQCFRLNNKLFGQGFQPGNTLVHVLHTIGPRWEAYFIILTPFVVAGLELHLPCALWAPQLSSSMPGSIACKGPAAI